MESPPIPKNELERLRALYSYNLLDTLPEESYNDLVAIAASICNTPVSLISLVDKNRCWFKAKIGLEQTEAPRNIAYAAHAINYPDGITIIEDALQDERFVDCPLVLDDPPMRFYAGTPLLSSEGYALGTLCVIDHQPRKLNETQISSLKKLARQVVSQFELRKKMNEVHELNTKLNDSYKDMESFSYTVSHDLKAPLRGIRSFTDLILEDYAEELSPDVKEMFQLVHFSAIRMDDLIESTLDLAKIVGKTPKIAHIDLSEIVTKVIDELVIPSHYSIKVEPNLMVFADAKLMRTVLDNLIGNAVKYSSKVEQPQIEIGQTIIKKTPTFFIKDNGVGFDTKHADSIFKPFKRLHGDSEFEGTGIGLAIVDKIIKKHGGKIWVDSTIQQGTTFYFSL